MRSHASQYSWIIVRQQASIFCLAAVASNSHEVNQGFSGKVLYSSCPLHGPYSVRKEVGSLSLYKVAEKNGPTGRRQFGDKWICTTMKRWGFAPGKNLDSLLSVVNEHSVEDIIEPSKFDSFVTRRSHERLRLEIAARYDVTPSKLKLCGGMSLLGTPLDEAHDVDVVIPIRSDAHLRSLDLGAQGPKCREVFEYGKRWPLRWYSREGYLVCPFFVFQGNGFPAIDVEVSDNVRDVSDLVIQDGAYSVFPTMVVLTKGEVDLIVVRDTSMRGEFKPGQVICARGYRSVVSSGSLRGWECLVVFDASSLKVGDS